MHVYIIIHRSVYIAIHILYNTIYERSSVNGASIISREQSSRVSKDDTVVFKIYKVIMYYIHVYNIYII